MGTERNPTKLSKVVVFPAETEDISKAVKFARANGLNIGIRGGGHNTSTASASDGLLLNMRKFNKVRVDEKAQVGYLQPGALVCDVENETAKYGLGACVGICSEVSMGGYVTGGGIGYSVGTHGLAADNLISATVVLASGEIVEASASESPDLFWAIRGGGSNFGVVAELRVKLHEQRPDAYVFSYTFLPEKIPEVVEEVNKWLKVQKVHETLFVTISLGPDLKPYVIVSGLSNAPQEEGEAAFNSFAALGPVQTTGGQIPWTQACHLLDAGNAIPNNKIIGGAHIDKFDAPQVQKTYETWQEWTNHAPYSGVMYEFYHYGKVAKVPIENAAFAQRHELKTVFCACVGFTDDFLPHARDAMINLKKVVSGSSSTFAQESLGYVNYGDAYCTLNETDEYARHFFKSNYPRLQEIKKKYDPEGVFNRWFAIKPAP